MPKSISIPLLFALLFTFIVGFLDYKKNSAAAFAGNVATDFIYAPNRDLLLSVFSQSFTLSTIGALFFILYITEKSTASQFGKTIRENISTIILALAISALFGIIELVSLLGKLLTPVSTLPLTPT